MHIRAVLTPFLAVAIILCADGEKALVAIAKEMDCTYRPACLAVGHRVFADVYHVQNVNAYDSRSKKWMRSFLTVATRYVDNYLG